MLCHVLLVIFVSSDLREWRIEQTTVIHAVERYIRKTTVMTPQTFPLENFISAFPYTFFEKRAEAQI